MSLRVLLITIVTIVVSTASALAAQGHRGTINAVAFSPDGRTFLSGSEDHTLILWDVGRRRLIRAFTGHTGAVRAVAFSPDGRYAISGSADATVKVWDLGDGHVERTIAVGTPVTALAVAASGAEILVGHYPGRLQLWNLTTGQQIRVFADAANGARSVALSRDGTMALSGIAKEAALWDATTGQPLRTLDGKSNEETTVSFAPDGRTALVGRMLYDLADGTLLRAFGSEYQGVYAATLSADGRLALTSDFDKLKLWDVASGKPAQTFQDTQRTIRCLALTPDGSTALTGGDDKALKLWSVASGRVVATIESAEAIESRNSFALMVGIPTALCWAMGLWLLYSHRRSDAAAQAVIGWPTVAGSVVSSEVERGNATAVGLSLIANILLLFSRTPAVAGGTYSYLPKVRYRYSVGDKSYFGERIHFLPDIFKLEASAEEAIKAYPAGTDVTVHYDPQEPGQSVLDVSEPGGDANYIVVLALAAVLTVMFTIAYFTV